MKILKNLFFGLTLSTVACTPTQETTPTASANGDLAIIVSAKANPFFTTMVNSALTQAQKYDDVDLQVFDSGDATDKELENVKIAISKGAKIILLNVVNSKTNSAVKYAQSKKVKVIALDRKVDGVDVSGSIYTDNEMAAMDLGKAVTKYVDDNKFAFSTSNSLQLRGVDSSASTSRNNGFPKGFLKWTGIKKQKADFNRQKAFEKTKTVLSTNDKLNFVYAENDEMALGAVKAFKEKNPTDSLLKNNIFVVGFDGTDDANKAIEAEDMFATVKQRPDNMGRWGVDWAVKLLGKTYQNKEELDKAKDGDLAINGEVVTKK